MKQNKVICKNLIETEKFAISLAQTLKSSDVICLEGELGVGKTVIAKAISKFFNVKDVVTSPTFNLVKSYKTNDKNIKVINHFDLYRIKNIDELVNIGFEEMIYAKYSISIIEWPDIYKINTNDKYINVIIKKIDNNVREIVYETK